MRYNIPQDGQELGLIVPARGLHQGDSLSPYLFILRAEGLSALIRCKEMMGLWYGCCVVRGALSVSYLFFADDCYLFFRAHDREGRVVKDVLQAYKSASGQVVNFNKAFISFSHNMSVDCKSELCF